MASPAPTRSIRKIQAVQRYGAPAIIVPGSALLEPEETLEQPPDMLKHLHLPTTTNTPRGRSRRDRGQRAAFLTDDRLSVLVSRGPDPTLEDSESFQRRQLQIKQEADRKEARKQRVAREEERIKQQERKRLIQEKEKASKKQRDLQQAQKNATASKKKEDSAAFNGPNESKVADSTIELRRTPSKRARGTPEGSPLVKFTISAETAIYRGQPEESSLVNYTVPAPLSTRQLPKPVSQTVSVAAAEKPCTVETTCLVDKPGIDKQQSLAAKTSVVAKKAPVAANIPNAGKQKPLADGVVDKKRATSVPVKKRGRPRKIPIEASTVSDNKSATSMPAKKRGRPRKIPIEASTVSDKKSATSVPAKKRGRPRKIPTEASTFAAMTAGTTIDAPPTATNTKAEEPRRKRGRPKKMSFPPTSPTNEQGLSPTNETKAKRARTMKDVDDKPKHKARYIKWKNCGNCLACLRTEDCGKCSPCCAGFDCLLRLCCIPTRVCPVKAKPKAVPAESVISTRATHVLITRETLDDAVSLSSNGSFGMADMSDLDEEVDDSFRWNRAPENGVAENNISASANNVYLENTKPAPCFAVNETTWIANVANVQEVDTVTESIIQQGVSTTNPPSQDSSAPIKAANPKERMPLSAAELARTIRQKQRLAAEETDDDESDEDDMMGTET